MAENTDTTETETTEDDPVTAAVKAAAKAKPAGKPADTLTTEANVEVTQDETKQETETEQAEDDEDGPAVREDGKAFTRKDHTALTAALAKARKDARDAKAEATRLTAAAGGKDVAQVVAEADTRAADKWRPLMIRAAARGAFAEAGLIVPEGNADAVLARAVQLLDTEALTINDDGLVEGLAEQVEELRSTFPGLFNTGQKQQAAPPKAPKVSTSDKKAAPTPKTAAELIAAQLTGAA